MFTPDELAESEELAQILTDMVPTGDEDLDLFDDELEPLELDDLDYRAERNAHYA